ncbi:hypothetical protein PIB30_077398 [Stylosanthes scabra]|uniref:SCP domain-containing protein n=1 Tax=Stylosanthes scabra TaxID=79078 RepID=A0ABU6QQ50_9FABA|nr:hypothetical protein [Stylosanthes scabra]
MERLQILAVIIVSFTSIFPVCLLAQNSPQDYLKIHNDARAAVGVKPLLWDQRLESYAIVFMRKHIEDCLEGEDIHPTGYSQNIAHTRTSEYLLTGADAVKSWVAQKRFYDYKTNSCITGNPGDCINYIAVVSKESTYLGCSRAICNNGCTLVTCYYAPTN